MFITFEGVEGAGKSTQVYLLKSFFEEQGKSVVLTKEPGGTELGLKIRQILLDKNNKIPPIAELFLYQADRNIHLNEIIKPSLEQGKVVICDRYYDSTTAYQGYARGLNFEMIHSLNSLASENLVPDLTIVLDLDVEEGFKRVLAYREKDRMEEESLEFHKKLRLGYLDLAKKNPNRFVVVSANQDKEVVFAEIKAQIAKVNSEQFHLSF